MGMKVGIELGNAEPSGCAGGVSTRGRYIYSLLSLSIARGVAGPPRPPPGPMLGHRKGRHLPRTSGLDDDALLCLNSSLVRKGGY